MDFRSETLAARLVRPCRAKFPAKKQIQSLGFEIVGNHKVFLHGHVVAASYRIGAEKHERTKTLVYLCKCFPQSEISVELGGDILIRYR